MFLTISCRHSCDRGVSVPAQALVREVVAARDVARVVVATANATLVAEVRAAAGDAEVVVFAPGPRTDAKKGR